MKTKLFLVMLCVAQIVVAQVKVNNVGNVVIGNNNPLPNTKLRLYNSITSSSPLPDAIFGLNAITEDFSTNTTQPMYGAYFKNKRSNPGYMGPPPANALYGVYIDNDYNAFGTSWGIYLKNNSNSSSPSYLYGIQATNTGGSNYGTYGIHLSNTLSTNTMYGVYSTNTNNSASSGSRTYGGYFYAYTPTTNNLSAVYGIYSQVASGHSNCYAGYFKGGKVVVENGKVGIGTSNPTFDLDVYGSIGTWGNQPIGSDKRLKRDVKPLSDEIYKLYILQGKSYIKTLPPSGLEEDSLSEKREIIEFPEYGYFAQELKEVFPDLVSQSSNGYYAINYIGLIPVIVEALKEQRMEKQREINELREQIKQLVKLLDLKAINEKLFEDNGIESLPILLQNTPNPFNQATEIGYFIPENVNSANIYIYDINGFQERNIPIYERGKGATTLQASALQAGIYFYTLICDGKPVDTKQMILTR